MKIITKGNIISTICISYTLVSLYMILVELLVGNFTTTHFNMLSALVITTIGVIILSLHNTLDFLPPLIMIIVQYLIATFLICGLILLASNFMDIHENGYKDMIISFTLPYIIGALLYYIHLKNEIRKQNESLNYIRSNR